METAGLFQVDLRGARGLDEVERSRGLSVEAEGIKMRTAQWRGLDDIGNIGRAQTQWPRGVADLIGRLTIDHGPFVTPEAAVRRGPRCGCLQQTQCRRDDHVRNTVWISVSTGVVNEVSPPRCEFANIPRHQHTGTGVPASQLRGPP